MRWLVRRETAAMTLGGFALLGAGIAVTVWGLVFAQFYGWGTPTPSTPKLFPDLAGVDTHLGQALVPAVLAGWVLLAGAVVRRRMATLGAGMLASLGLVLAYLVATNTPEPPHYLEGAIIAGAGLFLSAAAGLPLEIGAERAYERGTGKAKASKGIAASPGT
ncbi:MAG: hypothetical protein E6K18_02495 [Methanobacteriota archaeon]|nr:MAG: hypothetical protein E6K18_02495 [Euryarchaeota archaeon]